MFPDVTKTLTLASFFTDTVWLKSSKLNGFDESNYRSTIIHTIFDDLGLVWRSLVCRKQTANCVVVFLIDQSNLNIVWLLHTLKKIMHNMICLASVYLAEITDHVFFSSAFALEWMWVVWVYLLFCLPFVLTAVQEAGTQVEILYNGSAMDTAKWIWLA